MAQQEQSDGGQRRTGEASKFLRGSARGWREAGHGAGTAAGTRGHWGGSLWGTGSLWHLAPGDRAGVSGAASRALKKLEELHGPVGWAGGLWGKAEVGWLVLCLFYLFFFIIIISSRLPARSRSQR